MTEPGVKYLTINFKTLVSTDDKPDKITPIEYPPYIYYTQHHCIKLFSVILTKYLRLGTL
jgi:hypothetical protein